MTRRREDGEPAQSQGAPLHLLVVAGEASGDLHGANLVRELRDRLPSLRVTAVGGDRMEAQGVDLLYHYRHLAVVGLTEVIRHLGDVRRAMRRLVSAATSADVDGVVLIDYPDFNMTLARRLRRVRPQLPIVYYISPQVWAWRPGRVRAMRRLADRMLVILPFEKALYDDVGMPTEFVGHPLLDAIPEGGSRQDFADRHGVDPAAVWVGTLPGSRTAEVERLLPPMLGAMQELVTRGDYHFLLPRAAAVERGTYGRQISAATARVRERLHVIDNDYYELLRHSRAAIVCSGTATLEAALLETPEVVVYRASWLTYNLGKLLVRIRNIALVNVIGGSRGVPELLQGDANPARIVQELVPLLQEGARRERCMRFLRDVKDRLGQAGASARAAEAVIGTLRSVRAEPTKAPTSTASNR